MAVVLLGSTGATSMCEKWPRLEVRNVSGTDLEVYTVLPAQTGQHTGVLEADVRAGATGYVLLPGGPCASPDLEARTREGVVVDRLPGPLCDGAVWRAGAP